ncbi:MAG TPA: hypothetical protein VF121_01835 [Thermoanaerobaculia bacterium]|nr:hypothetical protein [Thermoanaerobaculia bacterium]
MHQVCSRTFWAYGLLGLLSAEVLSADVAVSADQKGGLLIRENSDEWQCLPLETTPTSYNISPPLALVGFPRAGRPQLISMTLGETEAALKFEPPLALPVAHWVIDTPVVSTANAQGALEQAAKVEKVGIEVKNDVVEPINVPAKFRDIEPKAVNSGFLKELGEQVGHKKGAVNIYWVRSVGGNCGWGWWSEDGLSAFIGKKAGQTLFGHELGHALSLGHVDELSGFDSLNFMTHASGNREHLTEGQIFRIHMDEHSIINTALDLKGSERTLDCSSSAICPPLSARVWPEGKYESECEDWTVVGAEALEPGSASRGHASKQRARLALNEAAVQAVEKWLEHDCAVNDDRLVALLRNYRAEARGILRSMLQVMARKGEGTGGIGAPGTIARLPPLAAALDESSGRANALLALGLIGGREDAELVKDFLEKSVDECDKLAALKAQALFESRGYDVR